MMRAILALVLLLGSTVARAQDDAAPLIVAILPLDGAPGTSSRDMKVFVRGLADAIGRDGRVVVVSGDALVDRLTEGKAAQLLEARDAFTEGQLLLSEGDPDIGLAFLAESVAGHRRAGSAVVRREEMADAAFILAKALLAVGDEDGAKAALTDAIRLLPDYLDTQNEAADPVLRGLALGVEADLLKKPPRRLSAAGAAALASDLQVDRVIHGFVVADGNLSISIFHKDQVQETLRAAPSALTLRLGDPLYGALGAPLVDAALGVAPPVVTPIPPVAPIAVPPSVPPVPRSGRAGRVALGLLIGAVAVGAATGGTLYAVQRRGGPTEAWQLDIVRVQ
ncbi:MAG: hypothetical protein AB8H79_14855 [Myxococcota bacterium]